jgi:hypothetical protein
LNIPPKPVILETFEVIDITTKTDNEVNEIIMDDPQTFTEPLAE